MQPVLESITAANEAYARQFGDKASLTLPPAKKVAILTCMDARLDPLAFAGLDLGDAHVIRNAGGRASDDAIRSLIISHKLLGTTEWLVIHHTDCGMQLFDDQIMANLLQDNLLTATIGPDGWANQAHGGGSIHGHYVKWYTFTNLEQSVRDDVARIRSHPLVSNAISISGYVYDVASGKLTRVD